MIVYNKKALENFRLLNQVKVWNKKSLIDDATFEKIKSAHQSDLYTPNFFIKIGLFVFTSILIAASLGLFTLLTDGFSDSSDLGLSIRFIIYALLVGFVGESIIRNKKFFRAGSDEAFQYATIFLVITAISLIINDLLNGLYNEQTIKLQIAFSLPIIVLGAIRYVDRLLSALAFAGVILLIFLLTSDAGIIRAICPFVIALVSFFTFRIVKKYSYTTKLLIWKDNFKTLELISLTTFYLSLNYFVVRELNASMSYQEIETQIPFAWLFYITTAIIPFIYIYFGIIKKDRLQLQLGLVLFAIAVFTFKYYFSLGHHEITLTLAGAAMIIVAWIVGKILREPKQGLTIAQDIVTNEFNISDAEALIIAQTMTNSTPENNSIEFGEGNFGGGGGGGKF